MYCMYCRCSLPVGAKYCCMCSTPVGKVSPIDSKSNDVGSNQVNSKMHYSSSNTSSSTTYNKKSSGKSLYFSNYRSIDKSTSDYDKDEKRGVSFMGSSKKHSFYLPHGCKIGPDGFLVNC